jgi:hypothetical protein
VGVGDTTVGVGGGVDVGGGLVGAETVMVGVGGDVAMGADVQAAARAAARISTTM